MFFLGRFRSYPFSSWKTETEDLIVRNKTTINDRVYCIRLKLLFAFILKRLIYSRDFVILKTLKKHLFR